jgi:hypothetical protein
MNGIIGSFRIGEDVEVALDALTGDPAIVTAITAQMKLAKVTTNRIVLDDSATALAMQVIPQGTAGWIISLDHVSTASLAPGIYGIDARLTIGGAVEMTEQTGFISITQAAVA